MLRKVWCEYLKAVKKSGELHQEADEFSSKAELLCDTNNVIYGTINKLYVETDKFHTKADQLYAEADKILADARMNFLDEVDSQYGNIELAWFNYLDRVEINGVIYTDDLGDDWNNQDCRNEKNRRKGCCGGGVRKR